MIKTLFLSIFSRIGFDLATIVGVDGDLLVTFAWLGYV